MANGCDTWYTQYDFRWDLGGISFLVSFRLKTCFWNLKYTWKKDKTMINSLTKSQAKVALFTFGCLICPPCVFLFWIWSCEYSPSFFTIFKLCTEFIFSYDGITWWLGIIFKNNVYRKEKLQRWNKLKQHKNVVTQKLQDILGYKIFSFKGADPIIQRSICTAQV